VKHPLQTIRTNAFRRNSAGARLAEPSHLCWFIRIAGPDSATIPAPSSCRTLCQTKTLGMFHVKHP
jgi:hypothetical protein